MIELGGEVFAADEAWRMPFLVLGAATLVVGIAVRRLLPPPGARPAVRPRDAAPDGASRRVGLAAVMAVYFVGDAAGLRTCGSRSSRSRSRSCSSAFVFTRRNTDVGAVLRNRDLVLINLAFIAVLWNLWFFCFWSVSIVADAARLALRPLGDDRRLQRRRRHPRLPGRRLAVRRRRAARASGASRSLVALHRARSSC